MHVLLVEDDALVASGIVAGLRLHGLTVDHVGTASLADTALLSSHFDVCVLDLGLPDQDGLTLLRRWRDQALEASRLKSEFLSMASHELRTPLAVLRAEIESLQDGVRPLDQTSIGSLATETARLARLVEDLLDPPAADAVGVGEPPEVVPGAAGRVDGLGLEEGADVVMVKPALPYLDVIRRVRESTDAPVAAYNVSGEYAMVKAAAAAGWLDERTAVLEALTGIRRAGADIVISYHAKDVARWLER